MNGILDLDETNHEIEVLDSIADDQLHRLSDVDSFDASNLSRAGHPDSHRTLFFIVLRE